MPIAATLADDLVESVPGQPATLAVRVLNDGDVVDELRLDVLGEPRGWTRVEPERLFLLPGESGVAHVVFEPPRDASVPAGVRPFGVRVRSREDPDAVDLEEATAVVGAFAALTVSVRPRVRRGRGRVRYAVEVDNAGNAPAEVALAGADDEAVLRYAFSAERLVVEPGVRAGVRLRVRPKRRQLTGPPVVRPFAVQAWHPGHPVPALAAAAYEQRSAVPPRVMRVAALLVVPAALVAAYVVKSGGLPPPPATAARTSTAVADNAAATARTAQRAAAAAQQQAAAAAREAERLKAQAASPPPGPLTTPYAVATTVHAPRADGPATEAAIAWPDGTALALTDLVLTNRAGDTVDVRVLRAGEVLFQFHADSPDPRALAFTTPVVFAEPGSLTVQVDCVATSAKGTPPECAPVVYTGGFLKAVA